MVGLTSLWLPLLVAAVLVFLASSILHMLGPDTHYLQVFRVAGAVAFIAYALGAPVPSIWEGQKWSTSFKFVRGATRPGRTSNRRCGTGAAACPAPWPRSVGLARG